MTEEEKNERKKGLEEDISRLDDQIKTQEPVSGPTPAVIIPTPAAPTIAKIMTDMETKNRWLRRIIIILIIMLGCSFVSNGVSYVSLRAVMSSRDDLKEQINCRGTFSAATSEAMAEVLKSIGLSSAAQIEAQLAGYQGNVARLEEIIASVPNLLQEQRDDVETLIDAARVQAEATERCA